MSQSKTSEAEFWASVEIAIAVALILVPALREVIVFAIHHGQYNAGYHCTEYECATEHGEDRVAFFTWALVMATLALAGFTGALFVATYALYSKTGEAVRDAASASARQAVEFEQQLAVARDTANANLTSVDSLKRSERAYILPVLHRVDVANLNARLHEILTATVTNEGEVKLRFGLRNFGRTPGVVLEVRADLRVYQGQEEIEDSARKLHAISDPILGPSEGTTEELSVAITLTTGDALRLLALPVRWQDVQPLLFEGYIEFEDVFGEREREEFAWVFNQQTGQLVPAMYPRRLRPQRES